MQSFWWNIKSSRWLGPLIAQSWLAVFGFSQNWNHLWEEFQIISEIQENTLGQLMVTRRIVWGPKVSTLKGSKVSVSCVQCFLYLVSFNKCLYFSEYMAGYLLDRPCVRLSSMVAVMMTTVLRKVSFPNKRAESVTCSPLQWLFGKSEPTFELVLLFQFLIMFSYGIPCNWPSPSLFLALYFASSWLFFTFWHQWNYCKLLQMFLKKVNRYWTNPLI